MCIVAALRLRVLIHAPYSSHFTLVFIHLGTNANCLLAGHSPTLMTHRERNSWNTSPLRNSAKNNTLHDLNTIEVDTHSSVNTIKL